MSVVHVIKICCLLVQFRFARLRRFQLRLSASAAEDVAALGQQLLLPAADLIRMKLMLSHDLVDRLDSIDSFERHSEPEAPRELAPLLRHSDLRIP